MIKQIFKLIKFFKIITWDFAMLMLLAFHCVLVIFLCFTIINLLSIWLGLI